MKVKNVSARAVMFRGAVFVPGETVEVDEKTANDLRGVASLEVEAKAEAKAAAKAVKKDGE
ncbi:MAG: hypothetical protein ACTHKB_00695 [Burkholderiaceae bacterium]